MTAATLMGSDDTDLNRFPPCGSCGLTLPLRTDTSAAKQAFICAGCGARVQGVLATDAPPKLLANIRLAIKVGSAPSQPPAAAPRRAARKALGERSAVASPAPTRASRAMDDALEQGVPLGVESVGLPFLESASDRGATPYDPETEQRLGARVDRSTEQVDAIVDSIERGEPIDVDETEAVTRDTLVQATADLDLFLKLGVNPTGDGYPGRHSLHTAMLAAGIGARLGWDRETVVQLGVGCLIHDLGMIKVPDKEYLRREVLDDVAFSQITAHPLHTFDLIEENMDAVPLTTRMVAYQIHERCDGSGYPRKRRAPLIHEAAKVAAIADVFIALVSPRPHRKPMMPYYAMEHLIRAAGAGRFDPDVTRALLRTVSLFPIGSCLELADGRVGRVLRSNPDSYTRPVIEAWRADELDAPPAIIDLSAEAEIRVHRALPSLSPEDRRAA